MCKAFYVHKSHDASMVPVRVYFKFVCVLVWCSTCVSIFQGKVPRVRSVLTYTVTMMHNNYRRARNVEAHDVMSILILVV